MEEDIPLLVRRGGRDLKKRYRSEMERTGWSITRNVSQWHSEMWRVSDLPVCAVSVASRLFIDRAATPPLEEGNLSRRSFVTVITKTSTNRPEEINRSRFGKFPLQ